MKKLKPCTSAVASKRNQWGKRLLRRNKSAAVRVLGVRFAAETNWELRVSGKILRRNPCDTRRVIIVSDTQTRRLHWRRLDAKQMPTATIWGMAVAGVA